MKTLVYNIESKTSWWLHERVIPETACDSNRIGASKWGIRSWVNQDVNLDDLCSSRSYCQHVVQLLRWLGGRLMVNGNFEVNRATVNVWIDLHIFLQHLGKSNNFRFYSGYATYRLLHVWKWRPNSFVKGGTCVVHVDGQLELRRWSPHLRWLDPTEEVISFLRNVAANHFNAFHR